MRFLLRCKSWPQDGKLESGWGSFVGVRWPFESHKNRMASASALVGSEKPIDLLNCSAKYKSIHAEEGRMS